MIPCVGTGVESEGDGDHDSHLHCHWIVSAFACRVDRVQELEKQQDGSN